MKKPLAYREKETLLAIVPDQRTVTCGKCGQVIACVGTGLLCETECSCGAVLPPVMTVDDYNREVMRRKKGKKCLAG